MSAVAQDLTDGLDIEALVQGWQRGDEVAGGRLYAAFAPRLVARIRRRLDDYHLAEDVAHDTWIALGRSIGRLDHRRPVWPWLAKIADDVVADHLRRNRTPSGIPRTVSLDALEGQSLPVSASEDDDVVLRLEFQTAVAKLPDKLRRAYVAVRIGGLTYSEASAVLDAQEAALRKRVERAATQLRVACRRLGHES